MTEIHYVLSVAYPDWKRPRLKQHFGQVKVTADNETQVKTALLKVLVDAIKSKDLGHCKSLLQIHNEVYRDCYMENQSFDIHYVIQNKWKHFEYTEAELMALLHKRKKRVRD